MPKAFNRLGYTERMTIANPEISVLMPVYNAAETLTTSLDSILAQQAADFEIVAVNDGSTDASSTLLAKYAAQDARLRVLDLPHRGLVAALQAGLLVCHGRYVARMDADDESHPQRLALQRDFLAENSQVGVVGCLVEYLSDSATSSGFARYVDWLNTLRTPAEIRASIFIESPLPHPSLMMRRTELLTLGGYQERGWPEDYDLLLRYNHAGRQFGKVPEILLSWRDHPTRLTRSDSRYAVENFIRAKVHYLLQGPIRQCQTLWLWGAGQMGRRIAKHLARGGAPLAGVVDINADKIGGQMRGLPIVAPEQLRSMWPHQPKPLLLVAVGAQQVRGVIRQELNGWGWRETEDYWYVA